MFGKPLGARSGAQVCTSLPRKIHTHTHTHTLSCRVSKDAPLRGEKNEPLLKVLSIKEKKFFKIYVFWALGHSGQFQGDKKSIF